LSLTLDTGTLGALESYLLESAQSLALQLDREYRVTKANVAAHQALGDEIVGRLFSELLVDFFSSVNLAERIARGASANQRLTLSTASGMPESFQFRFFPIPEGTLALGSIDLGEQLKLQRQILALNRELSDLARQLHLANAELIELNDLKNRFLAMAAHDLRKPVNVISIYSEFLLEEAAEKLGEEHAGFLRTCVDAADGMKRLIDNFLDISLIESGQLRIERVLTSVPELIHNAIPLVRLLADRRNVELVLDTRDANRRAFLDATKFSQILVNLLSNAIEHSEAGQRVWFSSRWEGPELLFTVRDEGCGIPEEHKPLLFLPFTRAGTLKTCGERSMGLGLSISRQVAEAHGGRIWLDPSEGPGTAFVVAVPADPGLQEVALAGQRPT
jgi:signal transduction histidine kinase